MATFYYRTRRVLEPRIGNPYATVYIKQDAKEHQRLLTWLVNIAESIIDISSVDADCATWFITPMPEFRKSQRGQYYSPQDLITDMIDQLAHGRDLPEAMLRRWNRLCEGTPWQIELVSIHDTTPEPQGLKALYA